MGFDVTLRQSMVADGILDRSDLEKVGVSVPTGQFQPAGIEAVNVVLDEMVRGAFQIPSCFRVSDQIHDDLKALVAHGLRADLVEKMEKYSQQTGCLQTAFDPKDIDIIGAEIDRAVVLFEEAYTLYERKVNAWREAGLRLDDRENADTVEVGDKDYEVASDRIEGIRSNIRHEIDLAQKAFDDASVGRLQALLERLPKKGLDSFDSLRWESRRNLTAATLKQLRETAEGVAGGKAHLAAVTPELGRLLDDPELRPSYDRFDYGYSKSMVIFLDGYPEEVVSEFLAHVEGLQRMVERDRTPRATVELKKDAFGKGFEVTTEHSLAGSRTVRFNQKSDHVYEAEAAQIAFRTIPLGQDRLAVVYDYRMTHDSLSSAFDYVGVEGCLENTEAMAERLVAGLGEFSEASQIDEARRRQLQSDQASLEEKLERARKHDRTLDRVNLGVSIPLGLALLGGIGTLIASGDDGWDQKKLWIGVGLTGGSLAGIIGTENAIDSHRQVPALEGQATRVANILKWDEVLQEEEGRRPRRRRP